MPTIQKKRDGNSLSAAALAFERALIRVHREIDFAPNQSQKKQGEHAYRYKYNDMRIT
jgi:hypothetical protein